MMLLIAVQRDRAGAEIGQHYELFNERVRPRVMTARHAATSLHALAKRDVITRMRPVKPLPPQAFSAIIKNI